ncbi:hypothetical protein D9757_009960 [Collybiopsis confluens]|uniref:Uncharacterized protein n=1 Tax=Collybiopsis confluens TaxID=2823264 RepID=A0A8H5H2C9_9AGAR|nr:hypothetical protein D9757_009960 [Collybiopsis confluens]
MCHGNLAQASANFINAQLSALWENSKACKDKESGTEDFADVVFKRGVALREFYGPQDEESNLPSFHVIFQAPSVEFLCSHELILYLKIEQGERGHYQTNNSNLKNTTVAARLSYHFDDVSTTLDGRNCAISILSIDSASATLIPERCTPPEGKTHNLDSLFSLLKNHYLPTLVDAGHVNLFNLPPSYTGRRDIDHGIALTHITSRPLVFDIHVEQLNEIFDHHWLQAISNHDSHKQGSIPLRDIYLAQYKASWFDGGLWANYQFSPLKIQALCDTEVVLFFKANIQVFGDEAEKEPEAELKDWEIAVIFQVIHQNNRILLDRFHPPRIASNLCTLHCEPNDEEFRDEFKTSILHEYIELFFEFGHYQLYPEYHQPSGPIPVIDDHSHGHIPTEPGPKPTPGTWPYPRPPLPVGPYHPGWKDDGFSIEWPSLWDSFVSETSLHGHHQLLSVTQAGINAYFFTLWKNAKSETHKQLLILTRFDSRAYSAGGAVAHLPHFSCELGAPQVELITHAGSKSIIMYFYVQNISFELSSKVHQFKDWVLAFQFDLKLISGDKPNEYKLIFDTSTADLLHHRSSFGSLIETKEASIIRSVYGSLSTNFIERYIHAFADAGQHVLYTIPIDRHVHGVADITFSIVPFSLSSFNGHIFQGLWGKSHHIVERNMIIFYTPDPSTPGPFGHPSPHPPHGTLLLSRDRFLGTYILKPLAQINARTTILCSFKGVERDNWHVSLETWDKQRLHDDCEWELVENRGGSLQYQWENSEEWQYDAHGRGIAAGTYTVNVKTQNRLSIPTTNHLGLLVMQLEGESSVLMQYEFEHERHWYGEVKATWKVPIQLVSEPGSGLAIKSDKQIRVSFEKNSQDHPEKAFDVGKAALERVDERFRAAFSSSVNIAEIISGVNENFSGIYQGLSLPHSDLVLTNPIFTDNGDLLLHLDVKTPDRENGGRDTPLSPRNGGYRRRSGKLGTVYSNCAGLDLTWNTDPLSIGGFLSPLMSPLPELTSAPVGPAKAASIVTAFATPRSGVVVESTVTPASFFTPKLGTVGKDSTTGSLVTPKNGVVVEDTNGHSNGLDLKKDEKAPSN